MLGNCAFSPEGEEAVAQAESEGLVLLRSDNATGFMGVFSSGGPKAYRAELRRNGTRQGLGHFATAEEAALAHARELGPERSKAAAAEELRRRMRELRLKLRRHAIIVGKAASLLQTMYTEVTFRPGHQGQKRSREEFEAAAAAQHA